MTFFDPISEAARHWQRQARRFSKRVLHGAASSEPSVMLELMRPNLGATPLPLRRLLEPLVAVCALAALVTLLGLGVASFAIFLLASALMYGILTQVFGIELGMHMPSSHG